MAFGNPPSLIADPERHARDSQLATCGTAARSSVADRDSNTKDPDLIPLCDKASRWSITAPMVPMRLGPAEILLRLRHQARHHSVILTCPQKTDHKRTTVLNWKNDDTAGTKTLQ
ncbi:hypothetical protein GEV33_010289 [Tenebrio molitor]|uniref:Uncharacterized protein n=1 Tax=Tenebrio molitor TaxID=7067 RepID=A0A8J6HE35_TENMO|nr:hypothetical protein GEV33_010289 [Tenebrio molitor]